MRIPRAPMNSMTDPRPPLPPVQAANSIPVQVPN